MSNTSGKYWKLLCDFEDCIDGGLRRPRRVPENLSFPGGAAVPDPAKASGGDSLEGIAEEVAGCRKCRLHETRTYTVPGMGPSDPVVMCVGEGPGAEEDKTGRPFVGRAGQYLDKWLEAIDLDRNTGCFIANIVKCRPPGNRDPQQDEAAACIPYLRRQIFLLQPRFILTLGRVASQILTGKTVGIGGLRGQTYEFMGIPLIPTYHPSGVLRNPELRKPVWDDLRRLKALIDGDHVR